MGIAESRTFFAFGKIIKSDIDFSDMLLTAEGEVDIFISEADIKKKEFEQSNVFRKGIQAGINIQGDTVTLNWPGIVRCQISGGQEINYKRLGDNLQTLKLFLLSEAIGILLAQRGYFLLHGSAVEINQKAHVFVGEPGAGKSTTAAAFWQAGQTVLTDDLVAIHVGKETIELIPSFPQFKIWENAIEGLAIDKEKLKPSFEGLKKYLVSQKKTGFPRKSIPLKSITILKAETDTEALSPLTVPIELLKHYPLPHQLMTGKLHQKHFKQAVQIGSLIQIEKINRPDGFSKLKAFVQSTIQKN